MKSYKHSYLVLSVILILVIAIIFIVLFIINQKPATTINVSTSDLLLSTQLEEPSNTTITNNFNKTKYTRNSSLPLGDTIYSSLKESGFERYKQNVLIDSSIDDIFFKTYDKDKVIIHGYSVALTEDEINIHIYINPESDLSDSFIKGAINSSYIHGLLDSTQIHSQSPDYTTNREKSNKILQQLDDLGIFFIQ